MAGDVVSDVKSVLVLQPVEIVWASRGLYNGLCCRFVFFLYWGLRVSISYLGAFIGRAELL